MSPINHNNKLPRSLEEWEHTSSKYFRELGETLNYYENRDMTEKIMLEADVIEHLIKKELVDLLRLKDDISLRKKYEEHVQCGSYKLLYCFSSTIHKNMQLFQGLIESTQDKSVLIENFDDWKILENPYLLETVHPKSKQKHRWLFEKVANDYHVYKIPLEMQKKIDRYIQK